jgi:putative ABC transport system substrate-binding protein
MRLKTFRLVVVLALVLLTAPLAADAQPRAKVPRIGFLSFGPSGLQQALVDAFLQGLRGLGYTEGQNAAIEYRFAEERQERLPELAAELVQLKVDILVAPSLAAYAAKQATQTIPIVMATSGDPVATGIVASLARPGGNITGLSLISPELAGKRLELLKEAVPGLVRVAVLWNATHPDKALEWRETQVAAQALGVQLQSLEVRGPDDFDSAFAAAAREQAAALIVLGDPLTYAHRTHIVDLAAKSRLPAMYELREFAAAGGFLAYGPSVPDNSRRAATFVDKILKGAKPGDLPIERPIQFKLIINLKTAQALGLTIPPSLLFQADEVVK